MAKLVVVLDKNGLIFEDFFGNVVFFEKVAKKISVRVVNRGKFKLNVIAFNHTKI